MCIVAKLCLIFRVGGWWWGMCDTIKNRSIHTITSDTGYVKFLRIPIALLFRAQYNFMFSIYSAT